VNELSAQWNALRDVAAATLVKEQRVAERMAAALCARLDGVRAEVRDRLRRAKGDVATIQRLQRSAGAAAGGAGARAELSLSEAGLWARAQAEADSAHATVVSQLRADATVAAALRGMGLDRSKRVWDEVGGLKLGLMAPARDAAGQLRSLVVAEEIAALRLERDREAAERAAAAVAAAAERAAAAAAAAAAKEKEKEKEKAQRELAKAAELRLKAKATASAYSARPPWSPAYAYDSSSSSEPSSPARPYAPVSSYRASPSAEPTVGYSARGHELHVGPRGGVYHYSASGNKVYHSRR
jgi:hypothetical protein